MSRAELGRAVSDRQASASPHLLAAWSPRDWTCMETSESQGPREGLLRARGLPSTNGASRTPGTAPTPSSVCGDRPMGLPGLGRGAEGPAVFRALASPRKPPPNTLHTPSQPVPGSSRNWSQALCSTLGLAKGEKGQVRLVQNLWPGLEVPAGRGGTKARHSSL